MSPKLRRFLPPAWAIVTLAAVELWMWSFDNLPSWAVLLVLLGLLGSVWVLGRYLRHRREAWETHGAGARRSE